MSRVSTRILVPVLFFLLTRLECTTGKSETLININNSVDKLRAAQNTSSTGGGVLSRPKEFRGADPGWILSPNPTHKGSYREKYPWWVRAYGVPLMVETSMERPACIVASLAVVSRADELGGELWRWWTPYLQNLGLPVGRLVQVVRRQVGSSHHKVKRRSDLLQLDARRAAARLLQQRPEREDREQRSGLRAAEHPEEPGKSLRNQTRA